MRVDGHPMHAKPVEGTAYMSSLLSDACHAVLLCCLAVMRSWLIFETVRGWPGEDQPSYPLVLITVLSQHTAALFWGKIMTFPIHGDIGRQVVLSCYFSFACFVLTPGNNMVVIFTLSTSGCVMSVWILWCAIVVFLCCVQKMRNSLAGRAKSSALGY